MNYGTKAMYHRPLPQKCVLCGKQFQPESTSARYCPAHSIGPERVKFLRQAWLKLREMHPEVADEILEKLRSERQEASPVETNPRPK